MTAILISSISAVLALLSVTIAFMAFRRTVLITRAQLFITLRSQFLSIHQSLPDELQDPGWDVQEQTPAWRAIERYWYNAFNEWFVTTKIFQGDREALWRNFYSHALQSALRHPSMRKVIKTMMASGSVSFGGFREEFRAELVALRQQLSLPLETPPEG